MTSTRTVQSPGQAARRPCRHTNRDAAGETCAYGIQGMGFVYNPTVASLCVFCKRPFDAARPSTKEHIVPDALGGWLTTDLVCKECNSHFGDHVDNIVNETLLRALRVEAGLAPTSILSAVYLDDELREVPGELQADGTMLETKRVFERGGDLTILEETPERGRKKAEQIAQKRALRGRPITFGEAITRPSEAVPMRLGTGTFEAMNSRLAREAAKVAVGYVGRIAGADVALRPD